jgi:hypothetical protein
VQRPIRFVPGVLSLREDSGRERKDDRDDKSPDRQSEQPGALHHDNLVCGVDVDGIDTLSH